MRGLQTVLLTALLGAQLAAQAGRIELPEPTGRHAVGTMTYAWEDEQRRQAFSSFAGDRRRITVRIWYPGSDDPKAVVAPYAPRSPDYRQVSCHARLRSAFGDEDRCPLVLISPGRGVEPFAYTTIAEELASHGYVVASVGMPEVGYVRYADGSIARPNPSFRPPRGLMSGPYEKVDAFFERPAEMGRRDLELALARLRRLDAADPAGRFSGRIDTDRVGVFGHSLGGRIAGAFAERNAKVRAYASMEGIAPRRARLTGLPMPVAMLCSSGTLPYAMKNYQTLIDGRAGVVFMVELKGFGHNSVTDFPYVGPGRFNYEVDARRGLETSAAVVRSFFNAHLKGMKAPFAKACDGLKHVKVTRHEPAVR